MNQVRQIEISVVIVNWNSREYVQRCIASIEANTPRVSYEIIVIDSGSFDGCESLLQRTHPSVRFLQSPVNLGFGRANTLAASHACGSVLLFLNPDTEVADGAIDGMYRHLTALTNAGVLGCRLLNSDGSLQTSCVQALPTIMNHVLNIDVVRHWFPDASLFGAEALYAQESAVAEVEAVSGACMMMRREVFALVGGFSSEYFMYGEDIDLCFKTRRLGLRNYHASDSVVMHHGGGSTRHEVSRFSAVMMVDSVNRYLRKSRGAVYGGGHRLGTVVAASIRLVTLGLIAPAALVFGARSRWYATASKWLFILRWGLGLERWTADYNGVSSAGRATHGAAT